MSALSRRIGRVLVATANDSLRAAVSKIVRARGVAVTEARSLREAIALLTASPDVLVFDVHLPGGDLLGLVDAANSVEPVPIRIALGIDLSGEEAFELARRGVCRLCALPIRRGDLWEAIDEAGREIRWDFLFDAVGAHAVHDVQLEVRELMTKQALALARGNRGLAARFLGISRQAVHQGLRRGGATFREGEPPSRNLPLGRDDA